MVLVRVVTSMRKDDVGLQLPLKGFEPALDLLALGGKETVFELLHVDAGAGSTGQEVECRVSRLIFPRPGPAQHAPSYVEPAALGDPSQQRSAGANLYIVRMGSQAQNPERVARIG
jgi:hypothetical protein